jgi:threonine dehydratase
MNLLHDIETAETRIRPHIYETPLEESLILSEQTGTHVFLKCEHLQRTGSFKFRGALNKILSLSEAERAKGVIAASTGNHGLGVALAAKIVGIPATIHVPHDASPMKLKSIESLGAQVEICEGDCLAAEIQARKVAENEGRVFISPYNDQTVIAGQGTIGLELFRQYKDLDAVFVSVGGGGLISGIASYLKQKSPATQIIGCYPENAPIMYECIKAGKIISVAEQPTLSDATAGNLEPGSITFPLCRDFIDHHILVSEDEMKQAIRLLAETERMIVEGAAGVALAAFLKMASSLKGKNVAIVLCGRNINFSKFIEVVK